MLGWIHEGTVRHRRYGAKPHDFRMSLRMPCVNVDRIQEVCRLSRFWSSNQENLASWQQRDFGFDEHRSIGDEIRDRIHRTLGFQTSQTCTCWRIRGTSGINSTRSPSTLRTTRKVCSRPSSPRSPTSLGESDTPTCTTVQMVSVHLTLPSSFTSHLSSRWTTGTNGDSTGRIVTLPSIWKTMPTVSGSSTPRLPPPKCR